MFRSWFQRTSASPTHRAGRVVRPYQPCFESLEDRAVPANGYLATALVSDEAGVALVQDANLVNAWGIALGATGGNFWVSNAETGTTSLFHGDVNGSPFEATAALPFVNLPGGAPTGQVFNPVATDFIVNDGLGHTGSAAFIFASESGQIFGWSPGVPPPPPSTTAQVAFTASDGAIYKGITIANNGTGNFLYATDFHNDKIDVFTNAFVKTTVAGNFSDPRIPAGFAPFNITNINGKLYVTFAQQDEAREDDVTGPHLGFVDVFDTNGNLLKRLVSRGPLNAPWGMALAPSNFGRFSNSLLIGNFGDGHINAFNPNNGAFKGTLGDGNGHAIEIEGLWGLVFGNGVTAGDKNALYFSAGPDDEEHGLFGSIKMVNNLTAGINPSRTFVNFGPDFAAGFLNIKNNGPAFSGTITLELSNVPDDVTLQNTVGHAANGNLLVTFTVDDVKAGGKLQLPLLFEGDFASASNAFLGFRLVNFFAGPFSSSPTA